VSWPPSGPIVVPVDFSGEEVGAIRAALDLAGGDADRVQAVHVLPPLDFAAPGVVFDDVTIESRRKAVDEAFEKLRGEHGWEGVGFEIRLGHPGNEVPDYAETLNAGLIVVPSHGYHGVKRFLLGSIAERIIRLATCNVLVLRRADAE
jgi:nucleotide-binding universal stress UspA family protein